MEDWPELENAYDQREKEKMEYVRALKAELFVSKVEEELNQRAKILELMEPWQHLETRLHDLAAEVGSPVMRLLQQMSMAYFYLKPEESQKLHSYFKITTSGKQYPPELCWEINKRKMYSVFRFLVKLFIDKQGEPLHFEVTVQDEKVLTCEPNLESLKETLVEAFRLGPYSKPNLKPLPGIPLEYEV